MNKVSKKITISQIDAVTVWVALSEAMCVTINDADMAHEVKMKRIKMLQKIQTKFDF